jgi:uncharacterized membrane protein YtjA (UPF0391 family)
MPAQRTHKNNKRLRVRDALQQVSGQTPSSMAFRGPGPPKSIFYFLVSALAASGFGFAGVLGTVPVDARVFFLSALVFLASQLLLF